ncbi:acyltransferase family protein [Cellulomonas aerilata]|uniref:Acyltransferase n=1 Tax=Cellulomonas aerilata TaxID=515326 RepID=A0A512DB17_9CELL|nr:acyltransferase [Cellulomonas aerilata]GEO33664.1 acyltransferase [Cellulomonas aerilata]
MSPAPRAIPSVAGAAADAPGRAVGRYAELEGYRGLAALAIVVFHVNQYAVTGVPELFGPRSGLTPRLLHGLDAFVELFFVLSAFLLTLPYARSALAGEPSPSGRAFAVRRAARIVPLYLVAVLVVWAWRNPVLPGDLVDLVEHLTFTQVFDQQRIFWTIGPAWSLAVEVHFYLLLALLGALACRLCRRVGPRARPAVLLGGTALLAGSSLAWKGVAWHVLDVPETSWPTWFTLPAKLDVFALGMALAVVVALGRTTLGRGAALAVRAASVGVLALAVATRPPQGEGEHVWFHSLAALGFGLLLASSVLGPRDRWVRMLGGPVPSFLGVVSYSLYLWHEPILLWLSGAGLLPPQDSPLVFPVGVAVLVPASVLVAWVSYLVIERPAATLGVLVDRSGKPRDYYDGS